MLKFKRQELLLKKLGEKGSIGLSDLVKVLKKPKLTVQRDLKELEEMGKLIRVHGGAVSGGRTYDSIPKNIRENVNIDLKHKLARKAVKFITVADTVCIDPSTTCEALADYLPDLSINVITPSIDMFLKLSGKENVKPILTGGRYNKQTKNLIGSLSIESIRKFRFSICFISADGFNPETGSVDFDFDDSAVKRAIIEVSSKVVLLIDSTKIGKTKGVLTCPIDNVTHIVTDGNIDKKWPQGVKDKIMKV